MPTPDRHVSRREAERLLDDPATHGSALGTLLAAAGAPTRPDELRREDATARAFHRTATVPSPGAPDAIVPATRRSGRAATRAAVATGAVVALASGGFALAGSADLPRIPGLARQASEPATESGATATTSSGASSTSPTPGAETTATRGPQTGTTGKSGSPTATAPTAPTSPTPSPTAPTAPTSSPTSPTSAPSPSPTPSPSLEGLCRAYQATDHSAKGSSLDSAAFAALVTAAGGASGVADYCVALIGEPKPTGKPSELPTPTSRPTPVTPTGSPTSQPTPTQPPGKPSTAPGKPTDQPSPTDKGGGRKP